MNTTATAATTATAKKRGRKPKNEYYLNKQPDTVETGNSAIILHLPISLEKCLKSKGSPVDVPHMILASNDFLGYFPENHYKKVKSKEYNTIDSFRAEAVHEDSLYVNETEQVVSEIYNSSLVPATLKPGKFVVHINCFWCCHRFTTQPIFMPLSYDTKKEKFKVKGCFCSFNCCMAYMDDSVKYKGKRYLLSHMYRVFTKDMRPLDISPAPPRELLHIFGGCLSIEQFRESFNKKITFQIQEYPISYIPTQIKKTSVLLKEKIKKIRPIVEEKSRPTMEEKARPIASDETVQEKSRPIPIKNSLSKIISQKN